MATRKVLLLICDGWGIGDGSPDDAIAATPTPYWDHLLSTYPHAKLLASGEDVGLPHGQMGNSEVGHLNIGAGRVVYQDLLKINNACRDGSIRENSALREALAYALENRKPVHFLGLLSDGGVHSSMDHLLTLAHVAKDFGIDRAFVHCFMDGRDTDPKSGLRFINLLQEQLNGDASIASVVGRYYAMDRDNRWDRVKQCYDLLVHASGTPASDPAHAIQQSYDQGITDEFIRPIVCTNTDGSPIASIAPGDVVIFFNYRNDRAKELTSVLSQHDLPEHGMHTIPDLYFCTMTPYDATFSNVHILFDKLNVPNTLAECLSLAGKKQLHIAETEKYAHVTFFFNGGREQPFPDEDRILVPSPSVSTYDLKPEMSAFEVKDELITAMLTNTYDFIVCNFANGDMVGHTGVYPAIQKAVKTIDDCLEETVEAALICGYEVIIIADHGNADFARNPDGSPNTAHSLNPVPIVYVFNDRPKDPELTDGILADVAPSVLSLMGIIQPNDMTGKPAISFGEIPAQLT